MRILHLAPRLSERGGADQHLLGILTSLADTQHNTLVVGRIDPGMSAPGEAIELAGLNASGLRNEALDLQPLDAFVERLAPEAIHLHNVVHPRVLEWAVGVRAFLTVQDHRFFCPGRGKWKADGTVCTEPMRAKTCAACFTDAGHFLARLALTRRRLRAASRLRLCVLSRYMRRELVALGLDRHRIRVIPPFVHGFDRCAPADGPPCALFVGRLVAAKGCWDAVEAWRQSRLDLPLLLAGTGSLRGELQAAGVQVLGWQDRDCLCRLYRRAQVLIMPPRWQEPFGMAGMEALQMGVPVAAWHSGGVSEWHPGQGLCRWGDRSALAASIRDLAGGRARAPAGFERDRLMARLLAAYRRPW